MNGGLKAMAPATSITRAAKERPAVVLVPRRRGFDRLGLKGRDFASGNAEGNASGLTGNPANESAPFELDHHAVD